MLLIVYNYSNAGTEMLDGGKDVLCFEVAHIGSHVVPVGATVGGGREGYDLLQHSFFVELIAVGILFFLL